MPLPIEDVLKIQRLYASYIQLFDRGDRDGWIECFTSDVLYRLVPRNDSGEWSKPIDVHGHDELRDYWDYRNNMYQGHVRHFSSDVMFDGSGDHATGSAHTMVVILTSGEPVIRITGRIEDELVRDASGTWRFKSRTAYPDL